MSISAESLQNLKGTGSKMSSGIVKRDRRHSAESFGKCLRTWMKETSRSIATLAAELKLKSHTTVARILQGESTSKACEKFYETLLSHVDVEEEWKDRFADALRAERIGLQQCALFEVLSQQLCQPRLNNAMPCSGDNSSILLILGCPWRQTFDYIFHCLAQEAGIRIYHYITSRELYEQPPVLEGLLTFLTETRYEAYLISEEDLFGFEISWNMMIRINPNDMEEEIAVKGSDTFSWLRLSKSQKLYLNCQD